MALLLGTTATGGQGQLDVGDGTPAAWQFTASDTGTLDTLAAYGKGFYGSNTIHLGLYTDSGSGYPDTLLGQGSVSVSGGPSWWSVTGLSIAVTSGTVYWVGVWGPSGSGITLWYTNLSLPAGIYDGGTSALPTTWPTTGNFNYGNDASIQGTGTAGQTYTDTGTGALILGGINSDAYGQTDIDVPTGALVLGGTVAQSGSRTDVDVPNGVVLLGGTAGSRISWSDTRTGNLILGGIEVDPPSTFPATPVRDTFVRTAENPLSDSGAWISPGSNTATSVYNWHYLATQGSYAYAPTVNAASTWATAYNAPVESYVTVARLPSTGYIYLFWVDITGGGNPQNGYYLAVTKTTWNIVGLLRGVQTTLSSGTWSLITGDSFGMSVNSDATITVYYKSTQATSGAWTTMGSYTATSWPMTSGYLALGTTDANTQFANFGGGQSQYTDTDTATGQLVLGGGITDQKSGADTTIGGVLFSAFPPPEAFAASQSVTGTEIVGGTLAEHKVITDIQTGSVSLAGTQAESWQNRLTRSGGIIVGGSLDATNSMSAVDTGSVTFRGSVQENKAYPDLSTGTMVLSGAVTRERKLGVDPSPGSLALSGTLTVASGFATPVSGNLILGGSLTDQVHSPDHLTGTLKLAGSLLDRKTASNLVGGALTLTGNANAVVPFWHYIDNLTGSLIMSGTNAERYYVDPPIVLASVGEGNPVRITLTEAVAGN